MFCPKCGANNEGNSRFCSACGADMSASNAQQPQYQQPPQYQPPQPQYQPPQYQPPQPQYQPPQYQQAPYQAAGGYRANIRKRSIGMCILLSLITCGVYPIIWFIGMADDLNTASGRTGDTSGGMVFLLSLITCGIYMWYWLYKAGEKVDMVRMHNREAASNSGILYILLSIFGLGIVSYCLIQNELNKVAAM